MMATLDKAVLWDTRVEKLEGQVSDGEARLEDTIPVVSRLIAEEAPEIKIAEARRDADAAEKDLQYLSRALIDARQALIEAREVQAVDALKDRGARVKKFQKQRAKVLEEAEALFTQFTEKLEESENLALELHTAAGGCRVVGDEINNRHGPLSTWLILKLLDVMPAAEVRLGQAVANHQHGRRQMEGKSLVDLQPDYAEMFLKFFAEKDKAA
jgi:chromosome segregation ATPase